MLSALQADSRGDFFALCHGFLAVCLSPEAAACPLAGGSLASSAAKALSLPNAHIQFSPGEKSDSETPGFKVLAHFSHNIVISAESELSLVF